MKKERILSEGMVYLATELVRPAAEAILKTLEMTWGPQWVEGMIEVPGLETPIFFFFGEKEEWKEEWGEERSFSHIAEKKFDAAKRLEVSTGHVANMFPWVLQKGEYLYSGAINYAGITVATSGAKGATDEGISNLIVDTLVMLGRIEAQKRIKAGEFEI
jgi:hypothetical protein